MNQPRLSAWQWVAHRYLTAITDRLDPGGLTQTQQSAWWPGGNQIHHIFWKKNIWFQKTQFPSNLLVIFCGQETERSPVCMARHAGSRIAVDRPDGRAADGIIRDHPVISSWLVVDQPL